MTLVILTTLILWFLMFLGLNRNIHSFEFETGKIPEEASLAILVAARNEEAGIVELLKSIESQRWLPRNIMILIGDDHSTDRTVELAEAFFRNSEQLTGRIISTKKAQGKKAVLRELLANTEADYIFFTDADTVLGPDTLGDHVKVLATGGKLASFGLVKFKERKGWWNKLLEAEHLNTQAVTQSFLAMKKPILASGANMMVLGTAKERLLASYNTNVESGDDTFFAQSLAKDEVGLCFHLSSEVTTLAPMSWTEFWNQRIRWASKSTHYESHLAKYFGAFIVALSLCWVLSLAYLLWLGWFLWFVVLWSAKTALEFSFHHAWFRAYGMDYKWHVSAALAILHPVYILAISVCSIFGIGYTWKGRQFRR